MFGFSTHNWAFSTPKTNLKLTGFFLSLWQLNEVIHLNAQCSLQCNINCENIIKIVQVIYLCATKRNFCHKTIFSVSEGNHIGTRHLLMMILGIIGEIGATIIKSSTRKKQFRQKILFSKSSEIETIKRFYFEVWLPTLRRR